MTWASATTSVATINTAGLATAVATGTSTISAMLGGITGSTVLTVTAAALMSIVVTPADPAIPEGEVQPFTATGTYSDNSTQDLTSQVTWASATTSVATIASDGLASGLAAGTTTVSATLGDVSGSTVLTVTPAVLEMIMVTPDNPAVSKGATESFMAMGMYSDNSTVDLTTQVTWGSSDTSVATISNDSGTQGLATAVGDGTSSISASLDGISGSTTITVSTADLNPVAVRDNGQAGYYQYGIWTIAAGGLNGTHSSADPATSSTASTRWLLNVPAGTYDVWGTWASGASNATNASYSVYDGFTNLGSAVENQQAAPAGGQYGGVAWAMLGTFTVAKGRITVVLSASGANGDVVADGILLVSSMAMDESAMVASTPAATEATGSSSSTASDAITDTAPTTQASLPVQPDPQAQATMIVPTQVAPAEGPSGSIPASIQISGLVAGSPSASSLTVKYTTDATAASGAAGSRLKQSIVLSKHASRRAVKSHQHAHETLIKHLAREQVSHKRSTGNHHSGK